MRYKPVLLITLVVSSLVLPLIFWQISHQQLLRRKAMEVLPTPAPREEEQTPISEWVPIDVNEFNTQTDKRVQELNLEISLIKKQRLSLQAQTKKLDPLERELNIQQINKEEHNLMDENQDGKIDYDEFNLRTARLYSLTYPLKHTPIKGKADGIYAEKGQTVDQAYLDRLSIVRPKTNNRFLIFVEGGLYDPGNPPNQNPIGEGLLQYKADIEAEGEYQPEIYACSNCSKEGMRNLLKTPGMTGTVFVGTLPSAWYEYASNSSIEIFPIDSYFMLLNFDWGPEKICSGQDPSDLQPTFCFYYPPVIKPVIFFGRLATPSESDEVALLNNYFRKNHLYRIGKLSLPKRALVYIDDDGAPAAGILSGELASAFKNRTTMADNEQTNATDYISRWDDDYEHVFIGSHSTFSTHFFYVPSLKEYTYVFSFQIKELKPHFFSFNLANCSAARYTETDYLAGWYTFQMGDYGLIAKGSTRDFSVSALNTLIVGWRPYYDYLGLLKNFGQAFKHWLSYHGGDFPLGMTLIGDPTLKISCPRPETPQVVAGANVTEPPGKIFLKIQDKTPNDLCQRKGYLSIWQNGVKIPGFGSGWMNLEQDATFSWTTPYLSPGNYEWRANLQNKDGQSCEEPLKVPFTVSSCSRPLAPEAEKGPRPEETVTQGQTLRLKIKDVSFEFSCHPLDVVFSIWPVGSLTPAKSSGWQQAFSWEFSTDDLSPGEYEWRANLKNTDKQTCERPLIIPFSIITETPTPTPTPRQYCCCLVECGAECWLDTTCSGRQKVLCDLSYCQ